MFAAAVAAALAVSFVTYDLLGAEYYDRIWLDRGRQLALLVCSVVMFAFACWEQLHPRTVLALGMGYEILGALVISASVFTVEPALQETMRGVSWLGVWILLFPLVAPNTPVRTLVTSLVAASTAPLTFLVWSGLHGAPLPGLGTLVNSFVPYYLCAGMAVVPAAFVQHLASDLSAAQNEAHELGTYRLVEQLGQGGMGAVWKAEHKLLRRPAAIKVIQPASTPEQQAALEARFEREASITGALRSPHTVTLYDFGHTADGSFYYVMELLEGIDLDTLVERFGPLPPERAVYLLRQICESLAEAHARGLVHRDIKPANLLACRLGVEFDFVKVLDFGLVAFSRGAEPSSGDSPKLTGEGAILGTPAYMSPEQAERRDDLDHRSDLYSIGCVAYWLLTGKVVFEQSSSMRTIVDHIKTEPERPSRRLGREVPAQLEELVLACLAKDPAARPQSAEELLERLEAVELLHGWGKAEARCWWREHLPELSAPPSTPEPSPVPAARQPSLARIAANPAR